MKTNDTLKYIILKKAENNTTKEAKAGNIITVNYTGWLNNNGQPGIKFDSSFDRNEPFSFILNGNQVIKGWDEGIMGMKKGEKRRLFIPSSLAYGQHGVTGIIPPNADLIFDIEVIDIK